MQVWSPEYGRRSSSPSCDLAPAALVEIDVTEPDLIDCCGFSVLVNAALPLGAAVKFRSPASTS